MTPRESAARRRGEVRARGVGTLLLALLLSAPLACTKVDAQGRPVTVGRLRLRTYPAGAKVWIDGVEKVEATPATLLLPEGTYRLRMQLPGAEPVEYTVGLDAGEAKELDLDVPRPPDATVTLLSDEVGAKVSINGYTRGSTPLLDAVTKPGALDMTVLTFDGRARSIRTTLAIAEHKRVELFFGEVDCRPPPPPPPPPPPMSRPPPRGLLTLGLEPEGEVRDEDDRLLGKTPLERVPLPVGTHRLLLRSKKRQKWVEVEIDEDRSAIYRFRLLPEDEPR